MFYLIRLTTYATRFFIAAWIIYISVWMGISRDYSILLGFLSIVFFMKVDSSIAETLVDAAVIPCLIYFFIMFLFEIFGIRYLFL